MLDEVVEDEAVEQQLHLREQAVVMEELLIGDFMFRSSSALGSGSWVTIAITWIELVESLWQRMPRWAGCSRLGT